MAPKTRKTSSLPIVIVAGCVIAGFASDGAPREVGGRTATTTASIAGPLDGGSRLPVRFEPNEGQWDARVRFVARSGGATLLVTEDAMVVTLGGGAAVRTSLVGAEKTSPEGEDELVTKASYFLGRDPSRWRTNVPSFAKVRARGWKPGVDVVWHGGPGGVEYDLEVAPGVDATDLELAIDGADAITLARDGSLHIDTPAGTLVQTAPRVFQEGRELATRYELPANRGVKVAIDGYDRRLAVLIDPVLAYSTFLGGSTRDTSTIEEIGVGLAVDGAGSAYVAGRTASIDFPATSGAFDTTASGSNDVFVAKLGPAGSTFVYVTYLGGSGDDDTGAIAIDASGHAVVTGRTTSTDFPTTAGALKTTSAGNVEAFVAKLSPTGSALVYSTYLGGSGAEWGTGVALDATGSAYIAGTTNSTDFPIMGGFQATLGGVRDAFVAKLNAAGSALVYSTYLGGSGDENIPHIALDAAGNAYVVGTVGSTNFPTASPMQATLGGGLLDGFVSKIAASGSALVYSTYLGGSGVDSAFDVAVDAAGSAYVAGLTHSVNFPGAASTAGRTSGDAFVAKLTPAGSALEWSTTVGGASGTDYALGLAVDASKNAWIGGETRSPTDFPLVDPIQAASGSGSDAFVTKLDAKGTPVFSTYLGGADHEYVGGVAVDGAGNAYLAGLTLSAGFPTKGAAQATNKGGGDVFVTKIGPAPVGAACKAAQECASGFCVDGVCCTSACAESCGACDVPGQIGTCAPVNGAPRGARAACGGAPPCAGACDGMSTSCRFPGATTGCGGGACENGKATPRVCDGKGACVDGAPWSCGHAPDGGPDAALGATTEAPPADGCGCNLAGSPETLAAWEIALAFALSATLVVRRRRRAERSDRSRSSRA